MKDAWSLSYAERCLQSIQDTESDIEATLFNATTPETIFPVAWTWPSGKKITCEKTNLFLKPYKTYDINKRIASPLHSQFYIWEEAMPMCRCIHRLRRSCNHVQT